MLVAFQFKLGAISVAEVLELGLGCMDKEG